MLVIATAGDTQRVDTVGSEGAPAVSSTRTGVLRYRQGPGVTTIAVRTGGVPGRSSQRGCAGYRAKALDT